MELWFKAFYTIFCCLNNYLFVLLFYFHTVCNNTNTGLLFICNLTSNIFRFLINNNFKHICNVTQMNNRLNISTERYLSNSLWKVYINQKRGTDQSRYFFNFFLFCVSKRNSYIIDFLLAYTNVDINVQLQFNNFN